MFVIKVMCVLACVWLISWAIYVFENHTAAQFGYRFFSTRAVAYSSAAFALIMVGRFLVLNARSSGNDELNGLVLMLVGSLTAIARTIWNMQQTNIGVGAIGSLIHLALFAVLSQLGPIALFVSVAAWAFMISFTIVKRSKETSVDD